MFFFLIKLWNLLLNYVIIWPCLLIIYQSWKSLTNVGTPRPISGAEINAILRTRIIFRETVNVFLINTSCSLTGNLSLIFVFYSYYLSWPGVVGRRSAYNSGQLHLGRNSKRVISFKIFHDWAVILLQRDYICVIRKKMYKMILTHLKLLYMLVWMGRPNESYPTFSV